MSLTEEKCTQRLCLKVNGKTRSLSQCLPLCLCARKRTSVLAGAAAVCISALVIRIADGVPRTPHQYIVHLRATPPACQSTRAYGSSQVPEAPVEEEVQVARALLVHRGSRPGLGTLGVDSVEDGVGPSVPARSVAP